MAIAVSNSSTFPNANFTTTPAYAGTFIPALWSGKLNTKFYRTTVFGEIANTSYEGEIKGVGDKITINNIPDITINDYTIGTALSYQVPTPSTVDLVIDKAKYFGVNVSDVLAYQAKPNLMSTFSDDASMQMKIAIDRDVLLSTCTQGAAANKGATAGALSAAYNLGIDNTPVTLSATNVLPLITALSTVLDEQNVPETDRFLVIPPFMRQWLMQSSLAQAYVTGDSQSPLRNGKIGRIDRFDIYVSNQLPSAAAGKALDNVTNQAGAVKRTAVMAGHKTAITFASQITKVESIQNPNDFGTLMRGLNVYGYKVIKPESLCLALVV
jgi:hypothetical protein